MLSVREAVIYLKTEYDLDVTAASLTNWIKRGNLDGSKTTTRWHTTKRSVDVAMATMSIPPKSGRKRTYTKEQRTQMCAMRGKHGLKEIATYFGCDESLVSRICRGLR